MSIVQMLRGTADGGGLSLSWIVTEEGCTGCSIQVARDSEFQNSCFQYITPVVTGARIDLGPGLWYYRVGAIKEGRIDWSGIPGPVQITQAATRPPRQLASFYKILRSRPLLNGVRIHTTNLRLTLAVIEYSQDPGFPASATKSRIFMDNAKGYFDCEHLDPTHTYHIRVASAAIETDASENPPKTAYQLAAWQMVNDTKPQAPSRPFSGEDMATRRLGETILKEANESKKPVRFSSSQEYAMYLAAKARYEGK